LWETLLIQHIDLMFASSEHKREHSRSVNKEKRIMMRQVIAPCTCVITLFLLSGATDAFGVRPLVSLSTNARVAKTLLQLDDRTTIEEDWPLPLPMWKSPAHNNVCEQTGVTLSRYMMEMARANPDLDDIESIMTSLQVACKTISSLVRRSSLDGLSGLQDESGNSVNVQGEQQKKLDVIANDVLKKALHWSGKLSTLASEEEDEPVLVDSFGNTVYSGEIVVEESEQYVAVFDPLDGSSNVDANIPTGTIFGIFKRNDECGIVDDFYDEDGGELINDTEKQCLADTLQPGKNLVAAGYCLYSAATTFVFTLGNGVFGFTLDETIGEFCLTHPNMIIPARGSVYSFNEANRWDWDYPLQEYIADIQQGLGDTNRRYTARYIGSMVADIHRTLLYGGIFGYPADKKNPDGKLRLLYEAAPMSFLVEQAGGLALTGNNQIMDLEPQSVHQRVPCILGSPADVSELRRYYEASDDPELAARCTARLKKTDIFTSTTNTTSTTLEIYQEFEL